MSSDAPAKVREYAEQAVAYVRRALGVALEYDSDTLPLLDHYLRTAPKDDPTQVATLKLVISTAAAYFGEVARRLFGGRWELGVDAAGGEAAQPATDGRAWRVVLPTGLNFSPAGMVAAAIARADLEDFDSEFEAPPRMKPYVQEALDRMGEITVEEYYSLCGRLDTLEHLHELLVGVAAQMLGDGAATTASGAEGADDDDASPAAAVPPGDGPDAAGDDVN